MKNRTSQNNFWDRLPLVSSLLIAASIFTYVGWLFDPNKPSDHLFTLSLNEIRNGYYLGLLTNGFLQKEVVLLVWGIGWLWRFGRIIENHVNILFYICLVISSIIFSQLFQILIFEAPGYGLGGLIYALLGFTWAMSMYEPAKWSVSYVEKLLAISFIFVCILISYTGIYKVGIAGLVGGFIWGVFVGFILGSIKNKILQISIPTFVLGVFLVPIFWAPWQGSWRLNECEKVYKRREFEKAKTLCRKAIEIDPQNETAKNDLRIVELYEEYLKYSNQREFEQAKKPLLQILEIVPDDENTKKLLKTLELYEDFLKYYDQRDFDKAKNSLSQILEIEPNDENTRKTLKMVELVEEFSEHYDQRDFDKARTSLLQLLEIDPNNEWANTKLKLIQNKTR